MCELRDPQGDNHGRKLCNLGMVMAKNGATLALKGESDGRYCAKKAGVRSHHPGCIGIGMGRMADLLAGRSFEWARDWLPGGCSS